MVLEKLKYLLAAAALVFPGDQGALSEVKGAVPLISCPDRHGQILNAGGAAVGRATISSETKGQAMHGQVPPYGSMIINTRDGFLTGRSVGELGIYRADFPDNQLVWQQGPAVQLVGPDICVKVSNESPAEQQIDVQYGLSSSSGSAPEPIDEPCPDAVIGTPIPGDENGAVVNNIKVPANETKKIKTQGGFTTFSVVVESDPAGASDAQSELMAKLRTAHTQVTIYRYPGPDGDKGRFPPLVIIPGDGRQKQCLSITANSAKLDVLAISRGRDLPVKVEEHVVFLPNVLVGNIDQHQKRLPKRRGGRIKVR